jgi:hypothetical protein
MPLRRAGTVPLTGAWDGPGSAAHRYAKSYALRCVRGTEKHDQASGRDIQLMIGIAGSTQPMPATT